MLFIVITALVYYCHKTVNFQRASDEFLSGHNHYRKGKYKEAINDALKSFESTMKTICEKKSWDYKKATGAGDLIDIMFKKKLVPDFMKDHLENLVKTLKKGLPTVRNKVSGHGQGEAITDVPCSLAQYALNPDFSVLRDKVLYNQSLTIFLGPHIWQ